MKLCLQMALLCGLFLFGEIFAQSGSGLTGSSAPSPEMRSEVYCQQAAELEAAAEAEADNAKKLVLLIQAAKTFESAAELEPDNEQKAELLFRASEVLRKAAHLEDNQEKNCILYHAKRLVLEAKLLQLEEAERRAQAAAETADSMQREAEKKSADAEEQTRAAQATLETARRIQAEAERRAQEADKIQRKALAAQRRAERDLDATRIRLAVETAIGKHDFRKAVQLIRANESLFDTDETEMFFDRIRQEQEVFDKFVTDKLSGFRYKFCFKQDPAEAVFADKIRRGVFTYDLLDDIFNIFRRYSIVRDVCVRNEIVDSRLSGTCEAGDLEGRSFLIAWVLFREYLRSVGTDGTNTRVRSFIVGFWSERSAIDGYAHFLLNHCYDNIDDNSAVLNVFEEYEPNALEEETRSIIDGLNIGQADYRDQVQQLLINFATLWLRANGEEVADGLGLPAIEQAIGLAIQNSNRRRSEPRRGNETARTDANETEHGGAPLGPVLPSS